RLDLAFDFSMHDRPLHHERHVVPVNVAPLERKDLTGSQPQARCDRRRGEVRLLDQSGTLVGLVPWLDEWGLPPVTVVLRPNQLHGVVSGNSITLSRRETGRAGNPVRDNVAFAMVCPLDPFRFVLIALSGGTNTRHSRLIDYLREENRVLREMGAVAAPDQI